MRTLAGTGAAACGGACNASHMEGVIALLSGHREAAMWVSGASAAMFVGTLLLVPWLVKRAPSDYFVREEEAARGSWPRLVLRNLAGALLVALGLLMLLLPGQGLLTLLIGVCLMDLPGKRALVRKLAQKPSVWRALGYLRERAHVPPFEHP